MTTVKRPKTPNINKETKLLSFDLETNGLHGDAFAIGAVVMDADGTVYDVFTGRSELNKEVDTWVESNVLPVISDMQVTYENSRDLREAFWQWYLQAEPKADYVLVNNGYPVEYRFLILCQEENLDERYWQHPFPILDLFSLLIQVGHKSVGGKNQLVSEIIKKHKFLPHHPLHDAKIQALAAFEAFKLSGQIG